jgi:hypothetical protein
MSPLPPEVVERFVARCPTGNRTAFETWVQGALDAAVEQFGTVAIEDPAALAFIAGVFEQAERPTTTTLTTQKAGEPGPT